MTEENNASNWFQDNLRIIISVGIVILLVFAIYSYSKRDSRTEVVVDDSQIEEVAMTADDSGNDQINEIIDEIKDDEQQATETTSTEEAEKGISEHEAQIALEQKIAEEAKQAEEQKAQAELEKQLQQELLAKEETKQQEIALAKKQEEEQKAQAELEKQIAQEAKAIEEKKQAEQKNESQTAKEVMKEVIESHSTQKKEGMIVVVAVHGDSQTTLARKAAAEYITANNISGLTPSHKIYIEDYIRKATQATNITPGTEMEFSNALISEAIEHSRNLSSNQLSNLAKYAANVPSL
jgi:FtsZ-interacting cell division protein ZipA